MGLLMCLLLKDIYLSAQVTPSLISFPSPNAASLGTYSEIPVSTFTGVPDISIPLYEINIGDVILPIKLMYHTHNVKPEIHPGWVGLGWNLISGGSITRVVHRWPDETNTPPDGSDNNLRPYMGYYFNYARMDTPYNNWKNDLPYKISTFAGLNIYDDYDFDGMDYPECEPDEFHFNFLGYNGVFYLNSKGQWQVKSDKKLKVDFNGNFITPFHKNVIYDAFISDAFGGFTITDEKGVRYIFGTEEAMEYNMGFFAMNLPKQSMATTWHLKEIITPSNKHITLSYERGPFIANFTRDIQAFTDRGSYNLPGINGSCGMSEYSQTFNGMLISPVYLKQITTDKEIISFNTSRSNDLSYTIEDFRNDIGSMKANLSFKGIIKSTERGRFPHLTKTFGINYYVENNIQPPYGPFAIDSVLRMLVWMKLDQISIKRLDQQLVKQIDFRYREDPKRRLSLSSIQEVANNGIKKSPYNFVYGIGGSAESDWGDTDGLINYPEVHYLRDRTDYWGFYNAGNTLNEDTLTAKGFVNYTAFKREKFNSLDYARHFLSRITYPTGGATELQYEFNTCRYRLGNDRTSLIREDTNMLVGGPRVKRIINYDLNNKEVERREYYYVTGFDTLQDLSKIGNLPSSGEISGIPVYYYDTLRYSSGSLNYVMSALTSRPTIPFTTNSAGSFIGYSEVVEKSKGGYTLYKYTNYSNGHLDEPHDGHFYPSNLAFAPFWNTNSREHERGRLSLTSIYDGSKQLLKRVAIKHAAIGVNIDGNSEYVRGLISSPLMYTCAFPVSPNLQWPAVSTIRYYTYSYLPVQREEVTFKPGDTSSFVKIIRDFVYDNQYKQLTQEKWVDSKALEQYIKYNYPYNYVTSSGSPVSAQSYPLTFMLQHNILPPIEIIKSLKKGGLEQVTNAEIRKYADYGFYDFTNHWHEVILRSKVLSLKTTQPVIDYRRYSVGYSGGKETDTSDSRVKVDVTFDRYDSVGNLLQYHPENSKNLSYLWAYNSTKPVAEVSNAGLSDIAYSSFETTEKGNWDFYINEPNNTEDQPAQPYVNAISGRRIYNMQYAYGGSIKKTGLDINKEYTLTLWYRSAEPLLAVNGIIQRQVIAQKGEWSLLQVRFKGAAMVELPQTEYDTYIDELRLYPSDADMTTYTYDPLLGITSKCDERNMMTYYSYDGLGRLKVIKDGDGKVLKEYDYQYKVPIAQ